MSENIFLSSYHRKSPFANALGLEEHSSEKNKCQEHFDVYKECKKKEVFYFFSHHM